MEISKIRCSKDGECYNIKDQTSRDLIDSMKTKLNEVITTLNGLSGVDGGHLATDEDIAALQSSINALDNAVNGKVEKMRNLTSPLNNAYVSEPNFGNTQLVPIDVNTSSYSIAERDIDGALFVEDPTHEKHAATKQYVDQQIANNADSGTNIITLNVDINSDITYSENTAPMMAGYDGLCEPYTLKSNAVNITVSDNLFETLCNIPSGGGCYACVQQNDNSNVLELPLLTRKTTTTIGTSSMYMYLFNGNTLYYIILNGIYKTCSITMFTNNEMIQSGTSANLNLKLVSIVK